MSIAKLPAGRRFIATNAIAGVLALVAGAAGGHLRLGLVVLLGLAVMSLLGFLPGELLQTSRARADERQRQLFIVAIVMSDAIVRLVVFIGILTELYRGTAGPFLLIAIVGSIAEITSLLLLPRTRMSV